MPSYTSFQVSFTMELSFGFIRILVVYNNVQGIFSQDKLGLSLPVNLPSHQYMELSQLFLALYVLPIISRAEISVSHLMVLTIVEG